MKKCSMVSVFILISVLCVNAQKTSVPTYRTVQVRPGVLKVPGFNLRAGSAARVDLKSIRSLNSTVFTELAPGQLLGEVEVSTVAPKMNIELTTQNFLNTKGAALLFNSPAFIMDAFFMGDITYGNCKNITGYQFFFITVEVIPGKQYLFRIPVTIDGTVTRTFTVSSGLYVDVQKLFSTSFSGTQEIAFTVNSQNDGFLYLLIRETSAYQPGFWSFSKVLISEL